LSRVADDDDYLHLRIFRSFDCDYRKVNNSRKKFWAIKELIFPPRRTEKRRGRQSINYKSLLSRHFHIQCIIQHEKNSLSLTTFTIISRVCVLFSHKKTHSTRNGISFLSLPFILSSSSSHRSPDRLQNNNV
jgi:hypothetical protein